MKTKTLLAAGLPLLLLVLVLVFPGHSASQSSPPLIVLINGPDYSPAKNVYTGSFSVNDPVQVRYLVYTVEDADVGTVTIPNTEVNLGGFNSRPFQLDGAQFAPEHKYVLKVQAVDWSGNLIERSGENYGQNAGEKFVLASKEFAHQPPKETEFEVKIDSVTPDLKANELSIIHKVLGGYEVLKYDGFINDDSGQRVSDIAMDLYPGHEVRVPLPDWFRMVTGAHKYKVTLRLYTKDDRQAEDVFDGEFTPPAPPGPVARVWAALAASPLIALAIVVVLSAVVTAIILIGKRPRNDLPPVRPPVTMTQTSPRRSRRSRLLVRIVQSPGAARGTEKQVITFPCSVGRDKTCAISIDDSHISRKHLDITWEDGHIFVTDLGGANGTFINDVRLRTGAATHISGAVSVRLGDRTVLDLETGD